MDMNLLGVAIVYKYVSFLNVRRPFKISCCVKDSVTLTTFLLRFFFSK